jgi:UDP-hydrolysing UDP-N-acetyl-D-glucosamine 2-epimerase
MSQQTIGVVTVSRSDAGIYLPVLKAIKNNQKFNLEIIAAGMHLSHEYGLTYKYLEEQGYKINEKIEMSMSTDTPEGVAKSMGLGVISFGQLFGKWKPDILMLLGDRYEMLAAATAAMPFTIPIAHLHGGETTEGAIDEAIRHSITKMSHLHFVSTVEYYNRVIQLGEQPWRVTLSGAPSLDSISTTKMWSKKQLEEKLLIKLNVPTLIVTIHPVTLEYLDTKKQVACVLSALDKLKLQVVFTYPNADTQGRTIIDAINKFVNQHKWAISIENLGQEGYFSLMRHASGMIGNSSSGIIESASFELPVVNIGKRQQGRLHGFNVIDVKYDKTEIVNAVNKILSTSFKRKLKGMINPYRNGNATAKIIQKLENKHNKEDLIIKRFFNIAPPNKFKIDLR